MPRQIWALKKAAKENAKAAAAAAAAAAECMLLGSSG
jgi:hypothetical protein